MANPVPTRTPLSTVSLVAPRDERQLEPVVRLLLTIPEAAQALGISRASFYRLILRGEVNSLVIGRARRVSITALTAFIQRQEGSGNLSENHEGGIV